MTALQVRLNRKTYPSRTPGMDHTALTGLDFAVPEGQFACIIGPSGCGKTTLLNIVGGLDSATDGSVSFGAGPGDATAIGYMFQTPRLLPWLTVLENVELVMDKAGIRSGRAQQLLKEMRVEDVMEAFPNRLSGGMRRRVALARAFAIEPQLLLMDEPFVSLEAPAANRLRRLLLDMWAARPTTVLFVTHDLREALYLADRVLFMSPSPGRLVLDLPVDIPRPRHPNDPVLEKLYQTLLEKYPELLAGLVRRPGEESAGEPGGDSGNDPRDLS
jgi:ABC-type nitrate/sulfonate/bicarbonate transport system ATPase subunit